MGQSQSYKQGSEEGRGGENGLELEDKDPDDEARRDASMES